MHLYPLLVNLLVRLQLNNVDKPTAKVLYFDTSALLKRYVSEIGSSWIVGLCHTSTDNIISTVIITKTEAAAALAAKLRNGGISATDYQIAEHSMFNDFTHSYRWIAVDLPLVDLASDLTKRQKLRGYDAIQLAAALTLNELLIEQEVSPLLFISADNDLLQAAANEGLTTDNPNLHP